MTTNRTINYPWPTLAIAAVLMTVANDVRGLKLTPAIQVPDGNAENRNAESKTGTIKTVLLKTVGGTKGGIQYRKEFTLTNADSKYNLSYSCVGRRCGCGKAEKEVEQSIAEEFLRNVATLKDQGESAKCCDHAWTEIKLIYSDRTSRKITVNDIRAAVGAKLFNIACASVESELKESVANRKVPPAMVISYEDMHPLRGGTTIVIRGDGRGERRVRSRKESRARVTHANLDQHQLLELIQQLITFKAWEQHTPNRQPVADESRATLTINVNGQTSESWEWFNEISKNNRLIQVKEKMLALK